MRFYCCWVIIQVWPLTDYSLQYEQESDNNDNTENDHLLLSDEKSSTVSTQDQFSPNDKSSDDESEDDGDHVDYKIDDDSEEFSNSSLLGRNDTKDGKKDFLVLIQTFNQ